MATAVMMRNPKTGLIKNGYFGFSWTYLFFGFWAPLFRSELGVAALHLLFSMVTFGFWQLIVSFLYNKQYSHRLIEKGYVFADSDGLNEMASQRLGVTLATMQANIQTQPV